MKKIFDTNFLSSKTCVMKTWNQNKQKTNVNCTLYDRETSLISNIEKKIKKN